MRVRLVFNDGREIEWDCPMPDGVYERMKICIPVLDHRGLGQYEHDFVLRRTSELALPTYGEVLTEEA